MSGNLTWDYVGIVHQELYSLRSDYLMIIFGVSTGLLALVGFVSFYIINNSKQKADDLQKLAWRLQSTKHKPYHKALIDETIELFFVCKKMIEHHKDFSFEMLSLLRWTLYFVLFTWFATFVLMDSLIEFLGFGLFYAIAGSLMLTFIYRLKKFRNSLLQGVFSDFEQFLGANEKGEMGTVWLAGVMSKLEIKCDPRNANARSIYFGLPLFDQDKKETAYRFRNLQLHQMIVRFRDESGIIRSIPVSGQTLSTPSMSTNYYDWYEIESGSPFVFPTHSTSMEIEFFMTKNHQIQKAKHDSTIPGIWLKYMINVDEISKLSNYNAPHSPITLNEGMICEDEINIHGDQALKIESKQRDLQPV